MCVFFFPFQLFGLSSSRQQWRSVRRLRRLRRVEEKRVPDAAAGRDRQTPVSPTPPTSLLFITYPTVNFIQVTDLDRSLHYYTHKHTYIYKHTKRRQNVNKTAIYINIILRVQTEKTCGGGRRSNVYIAGMCNIRMIPRATKIIQVY